jgi:hypothetical protein
MALPDSWLDHLFRKLGARYGEAWLRKWDGIPIADVRADWSEVLDGLSGDAIAYGLQYLPEDFPPTASAFRALCNGRPAQDRLALPAPDVKVNHAAVARIRAQVDEIASAGLVRERERQAKERQSRPRSTLPPEPRIWAPQGPLPWPRGVPKPDSEAQP